jgi:SAM-dependent methyltransferase
MSDRKARQIAAVLSVARPLAARASRIVDVGAGRGHLTRIAAETFGAISLGLERDRARVERATELANGRSGGRLAFREFDALRESLELGASDLVLGLHACGAVGDTMLRAAARARSSVVLVSCCLQKIETDLRAPLSQQALAAGFHLKRPMLGLSNLTPSEQGVEVPLAVTLRAREARCALLLLLRGRGLDMAWGDEIHGINRRRAQRGLADIAERALAARGLAPASDRELLEHAHRASHEFARIRRLSLPRALLAAPLELAVVLDRACYLVEEGYEAIVQHLYAREVSPRSLVIVASRREG